MLTLPAGRRSKFLVLAVLVLVAGALASQAGKLEDAQSTDPAAALPRGAESLEVARAIDAYPSGQASPAVTVVRRAEGLSGEDRRRIDRLREELNADRLAYAAATPAARVSEDGTTAVLITALRPPEDAPESAIADATEDLRERLGTISSPGLEVAVTGAAGFQTDIERVFEGINGTLLVGAALLVFVLLILIYRSPIFWAIPFFTVILTEAAARGAGFLLGEAGATIDGQAAGIASVLTFGAATDYALLLVARYREELHRQEDTHAAMRRALRSAAPTIIASSLTVVCALLTLLLADIGSSRSLGPLGATGVGLSMLFSLTVLPATLLIAGRRAFWPLIPRVDQQAGDPTRGVWGRLGRRVQRRPRPVWVAGLLLLAVLAVGISGTNLTAAQDTKFTGDVEAVTGQQLLAQAFPAGASSALEVIVPDPARVEAVALALGADRLVADVSAPERGASGPKLSVTLTADPFSDQGLAAIPAVRAVAQRAGGPDVLVGGQAAEDYDTRQAAERDTRVIVPVALLVVGLILVALIRALALPALLLFTVLASFAAAFGAGILAFDHIFDFAGQDPTLPLLSFVFLVALGVDYNIFLVARAREEAQRHGTRNGMLRALAATGSVITSAGIVLAGTFGILALLPFVALVELGFIIAFGVLLDTLLVRSIIVPALVFDIGPKVWWPARLAREPDQPGAPAPTTPVASPAPTVAGRPATDPAAWSRPRSPG
jgi:RND superfamily putative drug exporter